MKLRNPFKMPTDINEYYDSIFTLFVILIGAAVLIKLILLL